MKLYYTKEYKYEYLELGNTNNYMNLFIEPYINLYNFTFHSRPQLLLDTFNINIEGLEVNKNDIELMLKYLELCSKKEFNKFFMQNFGNLDDYRLFYKMLIKLSLVPIANTNNGIIKLLAF